jgi:transcriptional regulator with XRE-family HTH domain
MPPKIVSITALARKRRGKPRNFTSAEAVLDEVRERIFIDGRSYKKIAELAGLSQSTIANIAYSNTTWPRHTTLFPLMQVLGMKMSFTEVDNADNE